MRTRAARCRLDQPHHRHAGARVSLADWRTQRRPQVLQSVVCQAQAIAWSQRLLHLLLDELHISDDFDRLVGSTRRLTPAEYPPVIAIALVLRHSRCPQDFARTVRRLGLTRVTTSDIPPATPQTTGAATHAVGATSRSSRPVGRRPVRDIKEKP
jgi:hypothetical protein